MLCDIRHQNQTLPLLRGVETSPGQLCIETHAHDPHRFKWKRDKFDNFFLSMYWIMPTGKETTLTTRKRFDKNSLSPKETSLPCLPTRCLQPLPMRGRKTKIETYGWREGDLDKFKGKRNIITQTEDACFYMRYSWSFDGVNQKFEVVVRFWSSGWRLLSSPIMLLVMLSFMRWLALKLYLTGSTQSCHIHFGAFASIGGMRDGSLNNVRAWFTSFVLNVCCNELAIFGWEIK